RLSDAAVPLNAATFDRLFAGASALREAVEAAATDRTETRDLAPDVAVLDELLAAGPVPRPAGAAPAPAAAPAPRESVPPEREPSSRAEARNPDNQYVAVRSNMVRVDFAQLDHLLNLVGELVIYRTKLHQTARELADRLAQRDAGRELLDAVHHVAGVS